MLPQPRLRIETKSIAVCISLSVALLAIYWQTSRFEFVNWDDNAYIYDNPQILKGLTAENVLRAFTSTQNSLWHPIATITHLVDVELFGLWAGGHHVSNMLIHLAASLTLFFALRHLTGAFYESAFVAGLFSLHPLRVESVAWVTERKDVLTGFFLAALLLAYSFYARNPSMRRYSLVGILFTMGAMSKPSFVTVPFVLLLIDYWPLRRDEQQSSAIPITKHVWIGLAIEKLPLLFISALTCILTVRAQSQNAMVWLDQLPLSPRLLNAGRSYIVYLFQFIWPIELVPYYRFERGLIAYWQGVMSWFVIIAISLSIMRLAKARRVLWVGWFWYLGMLFPMIGVLQAGTQGHADRFTYLPHIGISIAVTFTLAEWFQRIRFSRHYLILGAVSILGVLSLLSWRQTRFWRDGVSLFTHAVDVVSPSEVSFNLLGVALQMQNRLTEATGMYERAIELNPNYSFAVSNLGSTLSVLGEAERAVPVLQRAIELDPGNSELANNLAASLNDLERYEEAVSLLEKLIARQPLLASAWVNLGLSRFRQGKTDEAIAHYRTALEINHDLPIAHANLAVALAQLGNRFEATLSFRRAIQFDPNDSQLLLNAAWVVATDPNATEQTKREGLDWAKRGIALTHGTSATHLIVLAASLAANNQFEEALFAVERVERLAIQEENVQVAETIRVHKELYRRKQPVR